MQAVNDTLALANPRTREAWVNAVAAFRDGELSETRRHTTDAAGKNWAQQLGPKPVLLQAHKRASRGFKPPRWPVRWRGRGLMGGIG